jgi:hypothetical protein
LHSIIERDVVLGAARLRDRGGVQLRVVLSDADAIAAVAVVVAAPTPPM